MAGEIVYSHHPTPPPFPRSSSSHRSFRRRSALPNHHFFPSRRPPPRMPLPGLAFVSSFAALGVPSLVGPPRLSHLPLPPPPPRPPPSHSLCSVHFRPFPALLG
ncbi:unnamed protein product [Cuscuta epithymum]|uniref:Uncharacterized protein n=1 Tax=Cuscuta epithymum TaxID=186058 RepID=A0AAV0FCG6_9ASTE|nr:unnamed protein product [Cuscuta epithymum]